MEVSLQMALLDKSPVSAIFMAMLHAATTLIGNKSQK